MKVIPEICHVH